MRAWTRLPGLVIVAVVAISIDLDDATTPPTAAHEDRFRLAFGSCTRQQMEQPLWPAVIAQEPAVWVSLGDNVYADTFVGSGKFRGATPAELAAAYAEQKNVPGYKALLESPIDVIGVWDDHDFGVNDGGASFPYRDESRDEFFKFFDEPADSPRRDQKGVYTDRWYYPSPGRSAHVILLDNRFNKDEYGEPDGDFLGEEQWRWFEAAVQQNASLTIIGSGLQILVDDRFGITQQVGENWARFPAARARLLAAVRTSPAPTLLLSGDIHFAELNEASYSPGSKHKVVELTSSSMTHSAARIFPNLPVSASVRWAIYRLMSLWSIVMPWKYRVETYVHDINFGVIDVDFASSTLKAQVHGQTGVVMEHSYDFDALVPPLDDGIATDELVPANGKAALGHFVQLAAIIVAAASIVIVFPGFCCWRVAKAIWGSDSAVAAAASPPVGNKYEQQKQNKKTK